MLSAPPPSPVDAAAYRQEALRRLHVTARQFAQETSVSPATVSGALNGLA
ncbi:hypothetical protein [Ensifer aridi]|nr:hypothetical protein [Ensifer aridi]